MAYFNRVPEILYLKYDKNPEDGTYITIRNIFARIKLIDDVVPGSTILEDYFVEDGQRPDTIAMEFYRDPGLDWIVMMINNIKNLYGDWPMTKVVFEEYVNSKYDSVEGIHHYETVEQKYDGEIILPGGLEVGEAYRFITPEGTTLSAEDSRGPVTNYIYELRKNDKKREIYILRPAFVDEFIEIFNREMKFTPSTEYVSENLKISKN